jgi:Ca2+-binding EF-hand superfamily protein
MNKTKILMLNMLATATVGIGSSVYAADIMQTKYDANYNKDRFTSADTNGDGMLSKQEAAAAMKGFEGKNGGERFDAADTNHDGMLSLQEATARVNLEKEHGVQKAREAQDEHYNSARFQDADTNGDGFVSRDEAAANKQWADKLGGNRFDEADTNHDGKLSMDEAKQEKLRERKVY